MITALATGTACGAIFGYVLGAAKDQEKKGAQYGAIVGIASVAMGILFGTVGTVITAVIGGLVTMAKLKLIHKSDVKHLQGRAADMANTVKAKEKDLENRIFGFGQDEKKA